jgi:hypothetical protein
MAEQISQATGSAAATGSHGTSVTGAAGGQTTTSASSSSETTPASNSSSPSKISQGAIIAIAVLVGIVVLLVAFIFWRFCMRRSKPALPLPVSTTPPVSTPHPAVVQPAIGISPSSYVYKAPTPMGQELPGNVAQRPIYEADPGQRVELDAQ